MAALGRSGEPERDSCPGGAVQVGREDGGLEEALQGRDRRLTVESQSELELGQLELAKLDRADLRPGLEVLGRHVQLPGEQSQRLHRGASHTRLDPGDVRIGDAGRRELALREALLLAEAPETRSDRLAAAVAPFDHDADIMPPGPAADRRETD